MHISSCELCACAVNGFAATPFAYEELVAIHHAIDAKTNTTVANPLTFAQFLIVLVSLCAIVGIYNLADAPATYTTVIHPATAVPLAQIPEPHETPGTSKEEISTTTKAFKKIVNAVRYKKFERAITPLEQLELMQPVSASAKSLSVAVNSDDEGVIAPHYDANVIYIYDLKVSDYNKLYFNLSPASDLSLLSRNIAPSRENKGSTGDEFGPEQHSIPADRVLKNGLAAFNKQDFSKALENFNLLIANNANDVNAHFYAALSYYNNNRTAKAIEELNAVLANENKAFQPEAEWYLALVTMKTDKEKGKAMLQAIAAEKGFYSKKAKEALIAK